MNNKATQPNKQQVDEDFRKLMEELKPKSWPLVKFAWYSFLAFIGAASIVGAAWMLMAFAERWL